MKKSDPINSTLRSSVFCARHIIIFSGIIFFLVSDCGCKPELQKTEILWDNYGVPHIYAGSMEEMYRALGYAEMSCHANLILKLYGEARGRASEYWGESYVASDKKILLFDLPAIASVNYDSMDKRYRSYLDAFVNGINEFASLHPEAIEDKYRQVLPVAPADVLSHLIRVLSLEFLASDDINTSARLAEPGSNSIAVAPSRSASGKSMLITNPHLPWSDFFIWFEAHLNSPGFTSYGIALAGTAPLAMAFNKDLGWAFTVNPIDASDRYKLNLRDSGYLLDGKIIPFIKKNSILKVKQADGSLKEISLEFLYSIHGPVVGINGDQAYAVRIAGMRNNRIFEQFHRMSAATDIDEFQSALKLLQIQMFNIIYADRSGNIFYMFNGNVPKRKVGDFAFWRGAIDGSRSDLIWNEIHPYEDLPKLLNPSTGFIQNCNDPPWTCTEPGILNPSKFPAYLAPLGTFLRPQRAVNMIKNNQSITFEQLIKYKHDTEMEAADRFLDDLLDAIGKYPSQTSLEAARVLRAWDKKTDASSRGAVLFAEWWDKVNYRMFEIPWDPKQPNITPDGIRDKKSAVEMLEVAAKSVLRQYGSIDVAWGDVYRLRYNGIDLPANGGPGDYGIFRTLYFSNDSDNKKHAIAGETYIAVIEFGQKVRAELLLSYGNATQKGNKHVGDQLKMLSEKRLRPALLERRTVLQNLERKEILN